MVKQQLARRWPILAVVLVVGHGLLHAYLQSRPGRSAIALFIAAPRVLFVLTVLTIAAAVYDILYGGWRRLIRGAVIFPIGALVASVLITLLTYRVYPSSYDERPAAWCLTLPLEGEVAVLQGGRALETNAHAGDPSQRYAYDLAIIRGGPGTAGDGTNLLSGVGEPVGAPVAGLVASAIDDTPDRTPGTGDHGYSSRAMGNHVVIQVDDAQYLFVGRLQSGSIRVRPGDRVISGEPLARVGSPDTGAPHVHVHLQDHPEPDRGEAIPLEVCRYEAIAWGATWDTARSVDRGMPTGRDRRQIVRRP